MRWPVFAALLCATLAAQAADDDWRRIAVPYYTPQRFVESLLRGHFEPRAAAFADQAHRLDDALRAHCERGDLASARRRWRAAAEAWESLSATSIGPLIARRSARRIDFRPARPATIERAVQAAPRGEDDMERIGAPGKGLPALEWLLFVRPAKPATPACTYAVQAVAAVAREADALAAAFAAARADDEGALAEALNQWIGGIESLRWQRIDKPSRTGEFPMAESGTTARAWAARWQSLRAVAATDYAPSPASGTALVTIEHLLRGRGLNPLASRLVVAVGNADRAMRSAAPTKADALRRAVRQLTALKRLAEDEVAPALQVSVGFSDADGD